MKFLHNDFEFTLDDEWWAAADMEGWKPLSRSYRSFPNAHDVLFADVNPTYERKLKYGVFGDDPVTGKTARDRVIDILRCFRKNDTLPPVEIIKAPFGAPHEVTLFHGAHRFYLSIAAGFTHVPAVKGPSL